METNSLINKRFGNCKIKRLLNRGGYGYSFIGWDEGIEKNRVVKVSKAPIGSAKFEDNEIENFRREGLILSRLKHPQIVTLIEQGEDNGYYYMILDYIEGFDFNNVIRVLKGKQKELGCYWSDLMDPLTALAIILSSLEPLAYAHEAKFKMPGQREVVKGLAHRDLSPGNLMLGSGHEYEGKIHLIDFGIAKTNINQSRTMNSAIIGSPTYISPMRLMKKGMGDGGGPFWKNFRQTQHDVHAMGVILYELLSGKKFVEAEDLPGAIAQIQTPLIYESLYKNIAIFEPGIQEFIKKSVVFPDIKKNKGPYQYKNASEMKFALEMVYNNLAGGAPINDVLSHFSKEIKEPDKLQPSKDASSRIAMYSKTKKVSTGFIQSSKSDLKKPVLMLAGILIAGLIGWFGYEVLNGRGGAVKEKREPLEDIKPKALPGVSKDKEAKMDELVKSMKSFKGKLDNPDSTKKHKGVENQLKDDSLKRAKNGKIKSSENAIDGNSKGKVPVERKIEGDKFDADKGLLVKRPAHSKVMKDRENRAARKKKIVKKSSSNKRGADAKKKYDKIRSQIKAGNKQGAYVSVKNALVKFKDPAFMLLKAFLIHERNPFSKEKERLINESMMKKSLVMTDEELEQMRARMR